MPPTMKYANRLCYAREVEAAQRLHRHRLATVQPTSHSNARVRPARPWLRPRLSRRHSPHEFCLWPPEVFLG